MGCPARAGIDPKISKGRDGWEGLPRASGDRPHANKNPELIKLAAPRERG